MVIPLRIKGAFEMNGKRYLLDTNAFIQLLSGNGSVRTINAVSRVAVAMRGARGNARERALYASNTPPPPSWPNGRNIGHSARRIRRAGRELPKQHRNLTRRRVFTLGLRSCFLFELAFKSRAETQRRREERQKLCVSAALREGRTHLTTELPNL